MNRSALPIALGLLLTVSMPATWAGQVWKCKDGDRTVFSDTPCPAQGAQIESRQLQGNVVQAEKVPAKAAPDATKPGRSQPKRARPGDRLKKRPVLPAATQLKAGG